jgi:recyclin-1
MDRWTTLEPVKLHQGSHPSTEKQPSKGTASFTAASQAHQNHAQFIGRLPSELHLLILHFLPIPDIPSYARVNRALSRLSGDERVWERRWRLLIGVENASEPNARVRAEEKMNALLHEIERRGAGAPRGHSNAYRNGTTGHSRASSRGSVDLGSMGSPGRVRASGGGYAYGSQNNRTSVPQGVLPVDDDFGDFAAADLASDEFDDFVGASPPTTGKKVENFTPLYTPSFASPGFFPPAAASPVPTAPSFPPNSIRATSFTSSSPSRTHFKRAYALLKPLLRIVHASTPPHALLTLLLPTPPPPPQAPVSPALKISEPTVQTQAQLLSALLRFLSYSFRPVRDWEVRAHALRSGVDVFDAGVLKAFEDADSKGEVKAMREASWAAWEVFTAWGVPRRKDIVGRSAEVGAGLKLGGPKRGGVGLGGGNKMVEWEIGKVWIERREEFYAQGTHDPMANFT